MIKAGRIIEHSGVQVNHPGGNPGTNLKSISHRCHPILVAFVWELTESYKSLSALNTSPPQVLFLGFIESVENPEFSYTHRSEFLHLSRDVAPVTLNPEPNLRKSIN